MTRIPFDANAIAGELLLVGIHSEALRLAVFSIKRRFSGFSRAFGRRRAQATQPAGDWAQVFRSKMAGDGSSRAHFADSPGAFQKTSRHFEINWDHWQRYARIDNTANWREVERVMRHQASNKKKLDYPDATDGTRWAAKARKLASKLTPEQEADHFRQAMAKIYGVQPKETIGAGL